MKLVVRTCESSYDESRLREAGIDVIVSKLYVGSNSYLGNAIPRRLATVQGPDQTLVAQGGRILLSVEFSITDRTITVVAVGTGPWRG